MPARATARVRVPATSANLGPGFDTLGLALGLWDEVELGVVDAPSCRVDVEGEGAGRVPRDGRHLVLRAAHATFDRAGAPRASLHLRCRNAIPHSRGLGSSAAAAVAGIVAARALLADTHPLDDAAVLDLAAGFDGHADNVAACLYGGLVVSWGHEGSWHAAHLTPHPALRPVALVADRSSSTEATRGLLPDRVPHADAAFTAARSALIVHALTSEPELLLAATEDRLHQPYRRPGLPRDRGGGRPPAGGRDPRGGLRGGADGARADPRRTAARRPRHHRLRRPPARGGHRGRAGRDGLTGASSPDAAARGVVVAGAHDGVYIDGHSDHACGASVPWFRHRSGPISPSVAGMPGGRTLMIAVRQLRGSSRPGPMILIGPPDRPGPARRPAPCGADTSAGQGGPRAGQEGPA